MRFWITLFALAVFAGGACLGIVLDRNVLAQAQPQPVTSGSRGSRSNELSVQQFKEQLALSDEQDRQVDLVLGETHRDMAAYGRAMRAAQDRAKTRLIEVLSADQQKQLDELKASERRKRSEQEVEKSAKLYASLLVLNADQARVVREALMEAREKRSVYLRENRHGGDWTQMRPYLKTLREEQNRKIEPALSPEQFKRFGEIQELMDR